ncbi:MarR family winged helix-turn-helix transcriptional regulator [Cellulomonas cellasea]|uniref:MarR family transcriptional regulator n=1 Tax=Cellulomonas cellasea TaxID=43670 RepID=A0A4Y3L3E3_9CELL|nr:MarR family transcriptional regulator [Cellulomonas cellasea]GEA89650.1 MarR family transcriptional regulator [Cellulomonas cellasea]
MSEPQDRVGDLTGAGPAGEPRWLTPSERGAWLALTAMTITLPGALDAQLQRDAGLSFYEYMVLAMLSEQPDRTLRMSQLAQLTNGSLSRLSHVATRLERAGFIRRERSTVDARATNAILTDEGVAKIVGSAPGHVEEARRLVIDALTPDQLEQLRAIGAAVMSRVDPGSTFPSEPAPGTSPA